MTARVIEYLSSFLPPWSGRPGSGRLEGIDFVLREFENLGADRQQEAARDLAQLWDSFVEHFGGIEGFLIGDEVRRRDYIQRVETAARRMRNAKSSDKGHYFFAAAMLAHYLQALADGATEDDDQRMANRVVTLIDEGRMLLAPTSNGEQGPVH
jgi:hypothetical protein